VPSKKVHTSILALNKHKPIGGPAYTFLKHQTTDELIEDLAALYAKLIELGVEYRNGEVYLADLEEKNV
jgi:hypothetical protein